MKLLYLIYFDINEPKMLGVKKKIISQIVSLKSLGFDVYLVYRSSDYLISHHIESDIIEKKKIKKGFSRYKNSIAKEISKKFIEEEFSYIYIRFPNALDLTVIKFLSKIPKNRIIFEVPTYPIKGEYKLELQRLFEERNFREYFIKILVFSQHILMTVIIRFRLDYIVSFMDFEKIWSVPVIKIDNGIDISLMKIIHKKHDSNIIRLTGVANVSKWHGFDRVIEGIALYGEKNITFNVVGDGPEIRSLKNRVTELELENQVKFLGPKFGRELEKIYQETDVAVSSLGMHRIGLISGSTLKTKEYCAMGLPFIYAYTEKEIPEDFPGTFKLTQEDSPINIQNVIDFYNRLPKGYDRDLNRLAKEKFTWDTQMKKIVNYYEGYENDK